MNKKIIFILLISLIARIILLIVDKNLWWDAAVYLSMGKYIASMGSIGLWEPIRPLVWPFILSYSYLLNINPIIWGHIFSTLFSLGCIYLTYLIGKKLFNENTGIIASIMLSFTSIFLLFNSRLYTEIPTAFFLLLAYYYFINDEPLVTGIFSALAFLTKFPAGLILILLGIFYLKDLKKLSICVSSFLITTIPYFVFNYIAYGSPYKVLLFAQEFLKYAGIWIFQQPWYYYFIELIKQNILLLLVIPGIIYSIKKKHYSLIIISLFFLIYFSIMPHKEVRFTILFLPFLILLASSVYEQIWKRIDLLIIILTIILILNVSIEPINNNPYFNYFEDKQINGELLITNPITSYYANAESTMMYYPWFNSSQSDYWLNYIKINPPEYISIDTCEGGFICPPNDKNCTTDYILNYVNQTYKIEYKQETINCKYLIYKRN